MPLIAHIIHRGPRAVATRLSTRGLRLFSTTNLYNYHQHIYPGQTLHPKLFPLLETLTSTKGPNAVRATDIWKIIFTASGAQDPVSTTNLKSFSDHHDDLIARDTITLCLTPSPTNLTRHWLADIAKSSGEYDDRPLELHVDSISSRILGYPVISDPQLAMLKYLDFHPDYNVLYILDPSHIIRSTTIMPASLGFNVLDIVRQIHALQTIDDYDLLLPSDWTPGRDALMPTGRHRRPNAVKALQRDMASAAVPIDPSADPEDGIIRDLDDDGEKVFHQSELLQEEYENRIVDASMPPGEVWEVLPYLRYVRIDDSVENTKSVIGYERMRKDLMTGFEKWKEEKEEKEREEMMEMMRRREQGMEDKERSHREKTVMELLRAAERGEVPEGFKKRKSSKEKEKVPRAMDKREYRLNDKAPSSREKTVMELLRAAERGELPEGFGKKKGT